MPTTQEISESLICENVNRAVADVFKTMLAKEVTLVTTATQAEAGAPAPGAGARVAAAPQVVGTVGFLGDINGLIYLHFPHALARIITGELLGMSESEIDMSGDETVNDAIGEITNMCVGSFKNGLCDAGFPCRLTIPSILSGSNFTIESISDAQRYLYRFACEGQTIATDILLKTGD